MRNRPNNPRWRHLCCTKPPAANSACTRILIDQIEHERAQGREPWDAVVEATSHRFRPILLTAAAAILGMIAIAPTIFRGPMAYAIMGGLAVATVLTLVFLPALYVSWFRVPAPREQHIASEDTCPSIPQPS
jgi:Cu/Ag efflux pump CusA